MRGKAVLSIALLLCLCVVFYVGFGVVAPKWADEVYDEELAAKKEDEARAKLSFESLEHRIPKGRPIPLPGSQSKEAQDRWALLDGNFESQSEHRADLLKHLHERTRRFFVRSPGEGSLRPVMPPEDVLLDKLYPQVALTQPGLPAAFPLSPGDDVPVIEPDSLLHERHTDGVSEFVYPSGFGYVKNRGRVAGFRPHGFRVLGVPMHPSRPWRVHYVQLVSILMNDKPLVYLSDKLPRMELLNTGRSRPLDSFEETGLKALAGGEDLYVIRKDETVRMLGALRATKQCLKCHDATDGDLLGAFSYTLRLVTADPRQHAPEALSLRTSLNGEVVILRPGNTWAPAVTK